MGHEVMVLEECPICSRHGCVRSDCLREMAAQIRRRNELEFQRTFNAAGGTVLRKANAYSLATLLHVALYLGGSFIAAAVLFGWWKGMVWIFRHI
jgi:hypothetical protein